jgi:putative endonuclease
MFYVYFLKSEKSKSFYIGVTKNIETRLKKHNNGSTKSTKPYRPWKLVYIEEFSDKKEAYKREWYLKHPKGYKEKLKIIENL